MFGRQTFAQLRMALRKKSCYLSQLQQCIRSIRFAENIHASCFVWVLYPWWSCHWLQCILFLIVNITCRGEAAKWRAKFMPWPLTPVDTFCGLGMTEVPFSPSRWMWPPANSPRLTGTNQGFDGVIFPWHLCHRSCLPWSRLSTGIYLQWTYCYTHSWLESILERCLKNQIYICWKHRS